MIGSNDCMKAEGEKRMNPAEPIVQMQGIRKHFAGRVALDGADLELMEGEILGLVGDNGAGKSTLLKILSGVLTRDDGTILIDGIPTPITSPETARSFGIEMVFQDLSLCGSLSVWENIYLGRYLTRFVAPFLSVIDKRRMSLYSAESLKQFGISLKNVNLPVRSLSGGEQQAVAMCRCLLFRPRILLLDEPTASMAVSNVIRILDMIRNLREQGSSVVMVSHNIQELFDVADRVQVLKGGKPSGAVLSKGYDRTIWCI
jgi:simple sugar transport system ATP-binding protein